MDCGPSKFSMDSVRLRLGGRTRTLRLVRLRLGEWGGLWIVDRGLGGGAVTTVVAIT